MPDISIQFHAKPSELAPWVRRWASTMRLHVVGTRHGPFEAKELAPEDIEASVIQGPYDRFLLMERKPPLPVSSAGQLAEKAPDGLYLDVGRQLPHGLQHSWLATRTGDRPLPENWKRIASDLRAMTKASAFAVFPAGAPRRVRDHRYTAGAMELQENGVRMLPVAGNMTMWLGATAPETKGGGK